MRLDRLPLRMPARLVSVPSSDEGLAFEGLVPGADIRVEARLPLGGPLIVCVGRARIAVARRVAATVTALPVSGEDA